MKTTSAILLASTALTLGFAIPAWSVMHDGPQSQARHATEDASSGSAHFLLASDDGRSDDDEGRHMSRSEDDDDDDEDTDDEDDDDGESQGSTGAAAGPAQTGTVVPPNNGLFRNGAAPKVKVN